MKVDNLGERKTSPDKKTRPDNSHPPSSREKESGAKGVYSSSPNLRGAMLADEAHITRCVNCGRRIPSNPILHRGYVFCSAECRDDYIRSKSGRST